MIVLSESLNGPKEIGSTVVDEPVEVKHLKNPIILFFTQVKALDVLMERLQALRGEMLG